MKNKLPVLITLFWLGMTLPAFAGPPSPDTGYVESIDARVTNFRFFETGPDLVPVDQREYRTRFPKETSRFIAWELSLAYPEKQRDVPLDIEEIFYLDGKRFLRREWNKMIRRGWTESWHAQSIGAAAPGAFEPGSYTLELFVDGEKIASRSFEVVSASEDPLGEEEAEDDNFPDDLGEL